MSTQKTVTRGVGFMGGIISAALFNLLIVSSLARGEHGSLLVGSYALAMAVIGPIRLFLEASLRGFLTGEPHPDQVYHIYRLTRLMSVAAMLVICSLAFIFMEHDFALLSVMILALLFRATESVADICLGMFLRTSKNKNYINSMLLRYIPATCVLGFCAYVLDQPLFGVFGALVVSFAILFLHDLPLAHKAVVLDKEMSATPQQAVALWMTYAIVGVSSLISATAHNAPRLGMEWLVGRQALGMFTVILTVGQVVEVFNQSLIQPSISKFAKNYHNTVDKAQAIKRFLLQGIVFSTTISLVASLGYFILGKWLLDVFFGAQYLPWYSVGFLMIVAKGLDGFKAYLKQSLYVMKAVGIQFWVAIPEFLVAFFLSWILIKNWGILGGGYTVVAISSVSVIIYAIVTYVQNKRVTLIRSSQH
jgi:O-antigen/teichoic acid export membrane protein